MPIFMFDLDSNLMQKFDSLEDASRATGISRTNISDACWKDPLGSEAKGFIWKFQRIPVVDPFEHTKDWKVNPKYPNYRISEDGQIYSIKFKRLRKLQLDNGYLNVQLMDLDGNKACEMIHRLVAETYLGNPNNLPVVNHIDGNKENNHKDNLEWVTLKGNAQHACDTGLNRCRKEVIKLDNDGNELARYESVKAASVAMGLSRDPIAAVCRGTVKTAGGFKWKYANQDEDE